MDVEKEKKADSIKRQTQFVGIYDHFMYLVALFAPISIIPQLITVWVTRHHQGVSLETWLAYSACSSFWLMYGIIHREKLLIYSQALLVFLGIFLIIGVMSIK